METALPDTVSTSDLARRPPDVDNEGTISQPGDQCRDKATNVDLDIGTQCEPLESVEPGYIRIYVVVFCCLCSPNGCMYASDECLPKRNILQVVFFPTTILFDNSAYFITSSRLRPLVICLSRIHKEGS